MAKQYIVHGNGTPRLVREILQKELSLSQNAIKKVKRGGLIVDGKVVTVRYILKDGETLSVSFPDEDGSDILPFEMPLDIVYEDDYLLGINKPPNMPVHPCRGNHLPTLAEGVMHYLGDGFVFRAVNRLDRDTSGIVLIAKDPDTAYRLGEQLKRGEVEKEYLALCKGKTSEKSGTIDAPIIRETEGNIRRVVREDGKRAITQYQVLSECERDGEATSLLCVVPITGRTHQIRVHLAHIGLPLLYDFLYGERVEGKHYYLHCEKLRFIHPFTNQKIEITAPCTFSLEI